VPNTDEVAKLASFEQYHDLSEKHGVKAVVNVTAVREEKSLKIINDGNSAICPTWAILDR